MMKKAWKPRVFLHPQHLGLTQPAILIHSRLPERDDFSKFAETRERARARIPARMLMLMGLLHSPPKVIAIIGAGKIPQKSRRAAAADNAARHFNCTTATTPHFSFRQGRDRRGEGGGAGSVRVHDFKRKYALFK